MRTFHHIGNGVYRVPMRRSAVTNQFIPEKEQPMSNVEVVIEEGVYEYAIEEYEGATYAIDPGRECLTILRDGKEVAHYPQGKFERVYLTGE